jgi:HEAT repeat protein
MSENPELREMAAYGMPLLGREHAILRLRAMLEDDVERVRVEAAWQLGKLGE